MKIVFEHGALTRGEFAEILRLSFLKICDEAVENSTLHSLYRSHALQRGGEVAVKHVIEWLEGPENVQVLEGQLEKLSLWMAFNPFQDLGHVVEIQGLSSEGQETPNYDTTAYELDAMDEQLEIIARLAKADRDLFRLTARPELVSKDDPSMCLLHHPPHVRLYETIKGGVEVNHGIKIWGGLLATLRWLGEFKVYPWGLRLNDVCAEVDSFNFSYVYLKNPLILPRSREFIFDERAPDLEVQSTVNQVKNACHLLLELCFEGNADQILETCRMQGAGLDAKKLQAMVEKGTAGDIESCRELLQELKALS